MSHNMITLMGINITYCRQYSLVMLVVKHREGYIVQFTGKSLKVCALDLVWLANCVLLL